jgi:Trk K+ transport system NAD-binding subunit
MEFLELSLAAGDRAVGKSISDIAAGLPEDCIVVSIHRGEKVIIPHGRTVVHEDDIITIYTRVDLIQELHTVFK